MSKVRVGAKVSKEYDTANPHRRAEAHQNVTDEDKTIPADTCARINPAAIRHQIAAHTAQLPTFAVSKSTPKIKTVISVLYTSPSADASRTRSTRAV
ncbi:hypothetical protein [Mycobacterium spongiae]|uniref:hypothetical protein n=1 Tax=Mycobacterium spongiae TaxID=886343 RepID=UPI001BACC4CB|nr:hypothetical protein [Mycobacterium spongiae]